MTWAIITAAVIAAATWRLSRRWRLRARIRRNTRAALRAGYTARQLTDWLCRAAYVNSDPSTLSRGQRVFLRDVLHGVAPCEDSPHPDAFADELTLIYHSVDTVEALQKAGIKPALAEDPTEDDPLQRRFEEFERRQRAYEEEDAA